jgi:peptidoglycan-associated lipoprotein
MKAYAAIAGAALLAACSSTPTTTSAPVTPQAAAPVAAPAAPPVSRPTTVATVVAPSPTPLQAFEKSRTNVAKESVFFDFDKSAIKSDQIPAIEDNAKLADAYARDRVIVQGNCDERGGREYNLALGQRRADEVKDRLKLLGVPVARIETVSFGEEKPRATCHDESCWAENRRADFVHQWQ